MIFRAVLAASKTILGFLVLSDLVLANALVISISGFAEVIDGNTIRLDEIDAPERDQQCLDAEGLPYACGQLSTRVLQQLTTAISITCTDNDLDNYGRQIMTCHSSKMNINQVMVNMGWAIAFRRYSETLLVASLCQRRRSATQPHVEGSAAEF